MSNWRQGQKGGVTSWVIFWLVVVAVLFFFGRVLLAIAKTVWEFLAKGDWFLPPNSPLSYVLIGVLALIPIAVVFKEIDEYGRRKKHDELGGVGVTLILLFILELFSWGGVPVWRTIFVHHWCLTLLYVCIGVLWSVLWKFLNLARDIRDERNANIMSDIAKIIEHINNSIESKSFSQHLEARLDLWYEGKDHDLTKLDVWLATFKKATLENIVIPEGFGALISKARPAHPRLTEYGEQIYLWLLFWPCSVLYDLLFDLLERLGKRILQLLEKAFAFITDMYKTKYTVVPAAPQSREDISAPGPAQHSADPRVE